MTDWEIKLRKLFNLLLKYDYDSSIFHREKTNDDYLDNKTNGYPDSLVIKYNKDREDTDQFLEDIYKLSMNHEVLSSKSCIIIPMTKKDYDYLVGDIQVVELIMRNKYRDTVIVGHQLLKSKILLHINNNLVESLPEIVITNGTGSICSNHMIDKQLSDLMNELKKCTDKVKLEIIENDASHFQIKNVNMWVHIKSMSTKKYEWYKRKLNIK